MNERIENLWSQAGGHYNNGNQHTWAQYTIDNPEKFVELIIRECVNQAHAEIMALRGVNDDMVYGADTVAVRIHRYFGVKE
jgi:hypothetical protein